jgi:hypothetical protein
MSTASTIYPDIQTLETRSKLKQTKNVQICIVWETVAEKGPSMGMVVDTKV